LPADYTYTAADAGVHVFKPMLNTAGNQTITATDANNSGLTTTTSNIKVVAVKAASLSVTGFPSPTTAGTPGNFTVTVLDAYNNVVMSWMGTVHFTSSDPQAVLPADYKFT